MKVKIRYKDINDMKHSTRAKSYYTSSLYVVKDLEELYSIEQAMINLHYIIIGMEIEE